jgi:pimeloyl-ACP methyl ester carboxylesterase
MTHSPQRIWLNGSPSLQFLDRPLLNCLAKQGDIMQWQYHQEKDEGSSLDKATRLLHDYLRLQEYPVHLIGHGISGVIGLQYARRYRDKVRSLTLLGVAAQPAMTWQTHYYVQRHLMPCSRQQILAAMVRSLFGACSPYPVRSLVRALDRDLTEAPCPHSLLSLKDLPKGGIAAPLLICGSQTDPVVHPPALQEWQNWMKPQDRLWECTNGHHFFHYFEPQLVADQILRFWNSPGCQSQVFPPAMAVPHLEPFATIGRDPASA